MKKIVLLLSIVFINIGMYAQFEAGNLLLSGTFRVGIDKSESSFDGNTTDGPKTTSFEIAPGLEYFLSDKISIGGDIGFNTQKRVEDNPSTGVDKYTYKSNMTTISPFASMYFINEERFSLFCKLDMGFGFGKSKNIYETGNDSEENETKINTFSVGLMPGINVHLSDRFGMRASFGWLGYDLTKYKYEDDSETKYSSVGLHFTPSLGFGLYFTLNSSKSSSSAESE